RSGWSCWVEVCNVWGKRWGGLRSTGAAGLTSRAGYKPVLQEEALMLPRVLEPEVMDTAEEARDYDAMDHSGVNRVFVADFLAAWDGRGPILDVGTGTALIPIEFCRQSPMGSVVAVDAAEHMLAVARENVRKAGLNHKIICQLVDAKGMPFADGSFPAVMSNSIVHHIPDPRTVFAEIARVAMSGATIFVRDLLRP